MSFRVSYSEKKIPQLKELLKERGLKLTGKKSELIERLEAYDEKIKSNEGMLLFCKTTTGAFYEVRIQSYETVLQLKNKIYNAMNGIIPVHKMILEVGMEKRVVLKDDSRICDYVIMPETTIFIIPRLI
jgi:hypothetical protein